jgi:hypothetical protein
MVTATPSRRIENKATARPGVTSQIWPVTEAGSQPARFMAISGLRDSLGYLMESVCAALPIENYSLESVTVKGNAVHIKYQAGQATEGPISTSHLKILNLTDGRELEYLKGVCQVRMEGSF